MKRVSPEEALRQHEEDVVAEKAAARLNLLINAAVFVAIVGAIRIGAVREALSVSCDTFCLFRALCLEVHVRLPVKRDKSLREVPFHYSFTFICVV